MWGDGLAVRDDGHGRVFAHVVDEPGAAARHDQIDDIVHAQQFIDVGAIGIADDLGGLGGELRTFERIPEQVAEHGVAYAPPLCRREERRRCRS